MPKTDPRIDAYIEKSAEFARPILQHLRKLVHDACPDVVETWKWSFPCFDHKGMMCHMASFKQHCTFGFWKQSLMGSDILPKEKTAMGSFGRITSLSDLPSDAAIRKLIKQAMKLNEAGAKVTKPKPAKKDVVVPDILLEALARNDKAAEAFNNFPPSCKREYIEWITDAKTEPTREKRLATTIEWLTEGKRKNWKYEKC